MKRHTILHSDHYSALEHLGLSISSLTEICFYLSLNQIYSETGSIGLKPGHQYTEE